MNREDRTREDNDELPELDLSDDDILDAMSHIQGYIDISTDDFRSIYHLAHRHAVERLFGRLRAASLMRAGVPVLAPDVMLDQAAMAIVASGYKGLPVLDTGGNVIGMLTETDYLRRLDARSFLELFLRLIENSCDISHRCHETPVREAMSAPAITVGVDAGIAEIVAAFGKHPGRSLPVVGSDGRFCGLLLRKDFLTATHLEGCL